MKYISNVSSSIEKNGNPLYRERISINDGWKFFRYTSEPDKLIYDERPAISNRNDNIVADTGAADSTFTKSSNNSLKKWILPYEAELFLNNRFLGKKKKQLYEYRFRWDSVLYEPGELKVITYKNGKQWATDTKRTAGKAATLRLTSDRSIISVDGKDLCFVTVRIIDQQGIIVPEAANRIKFEVSGPGEIVATDNGDPSDLISFDSKERDAFNGLALVIIRGKLKMKGTITLTAQSGGLPIAQINIKSL